MIEGFRPGVMERLGLGPDVCLAANPKLVYGRITGFGQDGPLAQTVGHDINYLAYSGALHGIGRKDQPPSPPLNLLADMGGGGMYLAFGIVCALLEASRSQKGQVVDVAMVEGVASLMTSVYGMRAAGLLHDRRGENYYDSGAPWYDSYETADGKYISVGAIEGRFYKTLVGLLGHRRRHSAASARPARLAGAAQALCRRFPHQDARRMGGADGRQGGMRGAGSHPGQRRAIRTCGRAAPSWRLPAWCSRRRCRASAARAPRRAARLRKRAPTRVPRSPPGASRPTKLRACKRQVSYPETANGMKADVRDKEARGRGWLGWNRAPRFASRVRRAAPGSTSPIRWGPTRPAPRSTTSPS